MTKQINVRDFDESVAKAIGLAIAKAVDDLRAELKEFAFKGLWEENREYKTGNFVTSGGALFHCNSPTKDKPGGSVHWSCVAARGRDGKDGKDFTPPPSDPPEKRVAHSVRQNGTRPR